MVAKCLEPLVPVWRQARDAVMEPRAETSPPPPSPPGGPASDRSRAAWAIAAATVVVALVVALLVVASNDDDDDLATEDATTSVADSTTSELEETTTTDSSTTTTATTAAPGSVTDAEASTIAWPDPLVGAGYGDPVEVATDFATEVLGFEDPVVGEFQQGDSRSGEVEVRAVADDGPVTTVGVRQMSDDRFYVLFAATSELELWLPTAGSAIDAPLEVEGQHNLVDAGDGWTSQFAGPIEIRVHDRATGATLGTGFVTSNTDDGAPIDEPFDAKIAWDNPGGGWGLVVAALAPGGHGRGTMVAMALPVGFIGGD